MGAIVARTLSYSACEFEMVDDVGDDKVRAVYNRATELWTELHSNLADRCEELRRVEKLNKKIREIEDRDGDLNDEQLYHRELHEDSDSEGEDSDDEDEALAEQKKLRRKFRNRKPKTMKVSASVELHPWRHHRQLMIESASFLFAPLFAGPVLVIAPALLSLAVHCLEGRSGDRDREEGCERGWHVLRDRSPIHWRSPRQGCREVFRNQPRQGFRFS